MEEQINPKWALIVGSASSNISVLRDQETLQTLTHILRTNHAACRSIGHPFITQLSTIYFDMLLIYKTVSGNIQQAMANHMDAADVVRSMRAVRREILKLVATWVSKSESPAEVSLLCGVISFFRSTV